MSPTDPPTIDGAPYLSAIVDTSDDSIIAQDLDGAIRACNAASTRIFGYSTEELLGQAIGILIPADRQTEEEEIVRRIRAGERVDHFETLRLTKDGRVIDVSVTISPVRDESGRVVGAFRIARDITEEKRARGQQAYLAAIVEHSEDAILAKDLNGIIQSCNPASEEIFGYTASELIGRSVRILIPEDRQGEEDDILAKIRRGERIDHFETVRVRKDGRPLEVSLSVSPIRDSSGSIVGVAKVARDITEQKRVARALAAQQEWFRVTLASIGDAVIASDIDGRVTFQNQRAEILTGWTADQAAGRPLEDIFCVVDEETGTRVPSSAERVLRSGRLVEMGNHTALISRDGASRPIAHSAAPIRDSRDRAIGVVLVFRDVTEERRAEESLAEQREWYETTLQSIGDAVIATDADGRVAFMNPIAERLTGWSDRGARGHDCSEVFRIINEDTRRSLESPVGRVLEEGIVVGLANHTLLVAANGAEIPIDDSGAPIRARDGRILGAVLVFRDITERRRSESERSAALQERERILASERAARAEAERATRLKDEFIATLSHELRTPLNAILGWAHLLTQPNPTLDLVQKGVEVIARNTRVQAQLISDLLDVSAILAGKLRLMIEQVDPAAVVADAIETVQPSAAEKHIVIRKELTNDVGSVAADSARLQQIVWNLLSNAIKFTPEGGSVTVGLRSVGPNVEMKVTDTGIGIVKDFLPRVFERFHQGSPSVGHTFGGLGLGLSIVKHLVDLHGGSVRAESAGVGLGATFTVVLPVGLVAGHRGIQSPSSVGSVEGMRLLEGIRLMIVEDDADTLDFLSRFLVSCGADVVAATSGHEALTLLPDSEADILVTDIGLPEMDGYELIRRIRGSERWGAIPAVALTAYARADDRARAFGAGFQAHLAKPVEPPELATTISRLATRPRDRHRG